MKNILKINSRYPPKNTSFDDIFSFFWNHGVGNTLDKDGDPRPWTPETLEAACESAGKPVDRRTIQNWRSGKNKPSRRNMHVLAKVASGGEERQRQAWADSFIATLDTPATKPKSTSKPILDQSNTPELPATNIKTRSNFKRVSGLTGGILAASFAVLAFRHSSRPTLNDMRLAVMPIENLSESSAETYISDGITADIILSLTQLPDLYVTPRRNSRSLNRNTLSIEEIGQSLDVEYLLEGTMQVDAGRIKLSTNLIHIETGDTVWAGQFDDQTDDLFSIQEGVAEGVTQALDIIMTPDWRAQMFNFGTENVEAYRQYLKGRHLMKFWHETHAGDDIWRAGEALEAAVAADPSMGRAWVHMTDLYHHYAADHIDAPTDALNVTVPKTRAATWDHLKTLFANGEKYGDETTALQAKANRIFFSNDWTGLRPAVLDYAKQVTPQLGELEWLYVPIMLALLGETEVQTRLMEERVLKFDPGNGTGHAYVIRQYLTGAQYDRAQKRISEAEALTFSNRLAEVKGYMHVSERDGAALRKHIKTSESRLSPMLSEYFSVLAQFFSGDTASALNGLSESEALKNDPIHLALTHHHMGNAATAERLLYEIAQTPIGTIQIAVQLSYGAGCGPNKLPPIPPLDARMLEAGMAQLPCIGRAAPPSLAESFEK